MMKKIISSLLCILIMLCSTVCFAADPIRVELDYAPITFDQDPMIVNDRTMVPVRAIFEAMGASVEWNAETQTVISRLGNLTVVMVIDNPVMTINGGIKTMDTAPIIRGGRTLVPVRAVSESFGCEVAWDGNKRLVSIFSQDFQKRIETADSFGYVKQLTDGTKKANAAFGLSYFHDYTVKTDTADGTVIEISATSDAGHASLNIRTDLYSGKEEPPTEAYAESVAEGIVTVLSGTLIYAGVTKINGTDFVEITYTAPGIVHGITDMDPETTIYIARKNGVVYTMTYTVHGEVNKDTRSDFGYMIHSMLIA